MTTNSQELLNLFGRLIQNRSFTMMAMRSSRFGDRAEENQRRGPLRLLQLLAERDHLTNTEIAEVLDIRPSSVSALVKKLEEGSLIERIPDPNDGRATFIVLTDQGRASIDDTREFKDAMSEKMFAALSADEQAQLTTLIRKMVENLDPEDDTFERMAHHNPFMHGHHFDNHQGRDFFGNMFRGPRQ